MDPFKARQLFEGVDDPKEMGTTGLSAWVYAGPGHTDKLWNRYRIARKVIVSRGLQPRRFAEAVKSYGGRWFGDRIDRYEDTLERMSRGVGSR